MSADHFALAGLATAAVPELVVTQVAPWTAQSTGNFDSALLRDAAGQTLIVRKAITQAARIELSAQRLALSALTSGMRSRLPFAVPRALGTITTREVQLGVFDFLSGTPVAAVPLDFDGELIVEIARAIAAIHSLPRGAVVDAQLPQETASQAREAAEDLIDRAADTGRLPRALMERWGAAVEDARLWEFTPTVVHGSLELDAILTNGVAVTGILGWSDLGVGDPARDLRWAQSVDGATARTFFDEYVEARGDSVDSQLLQRSILYAELELARWLLHGIALDDDAVVADAEQLLDGLVTRVRALDERELRHETMPVLDVREVQQLLADAGSKMRSVTAEVDSGATFRTEPVAPAEYQEDEVEDLADDTPEDERER